MRFVEPELPAAPRSVRPPASGRTIPRNGHEQAFAGDPWCWRLAGPPTAASEPDPGRASSEEGLERQGLDARLADRQERKDGPRHDGQPPVTRAATVRGLSNSASMRSGTATGHAIGTATTPTLTAIAKPRRLFQPSSSCGAPSTATASVNVVHASQEGDFPNALSSASYRPP